MDPAQAIVGRPPLRATAGPVLSSLATHRARQAERALEFGGVYARDLDLVFANEVGRPLDLANLRERYYKRICQAAGIEGVRGL